MSLQLTVPGTATHCIDTWRRRAVSAGNIENIGQGRAGGGLKKGLNRSNSPRGWGHITP